MKRSCLENLYFKKQDNNSLRAYKKQKSFGRLYKNESKIFFNNINPEFVSGNTLFWKTMKPLFSNEDSYNANI